MQRDETAAVSPALRVPRYPPDCCRANPLRALLLRRDAAPLEFPRRFRECAAAGSQNVFGTNATVANARQEPARPKLHGWYQHTNRWESGARGLPELFHFHAPDLCLVPMVRSKLDASRQTASAGRGATLNRASRPRVSPPTAAPQKQMCLVSLVWNSIFPILIDATGIAGFLQ